VIYNNSGKIRVLKDKAVLEDSQTMINGVDDEKR